MPEAINIPYMDDTADGSGIRHPPVEIGSLSHKFTTGFYRSKRWLFGISEPSTLVGGFNHLKNISQIGSFP